MDEHRSRAAVDGYTILPGAVPTALCHMAIRVVEQTAGNLVEGNKGNRNNPTSTSTSSSTRSSIPFESLVASPTITKLFTQPQLHLAVAQIAGVDLHPVYHGQVPHCLPHCTYSSPNRITTANLEQRGQPPLGSALQGGGLLALPAPQSLWTVLPFSERPRLDAACLGDPLMLSLRSTGTTAIWIRQRGTWVHRSCTPNHRSCGSQRDHSIQCNPKTLHRMHIVNNKYAAINPPEH